jgi:8-oxo-dGTP pyrophosphatase MutT (NUDIX family)
MKEFIKKRLLEGVSTNEKGKPSKAAGVLIKCRKTDRVLLLLRAEGEHKNTWAMISGGIDEGEDVLTGLKREILEETKIKADDEETKIDFKFIKEIVNTDKDSEFYYYEGFTNSEFLPKLNHENHDYKWCDKDNLPSPLYPGLIDKINNIEDEQEEFRR